MSALAINTCKCGATPAQDSTPRLYERGRGRFPYFVSCDRCGRQTTATATRGAAIALWNKHQHLLGPAS